MKIGCIVVAAGKGTRAGYEKNKVFFPIGVHCVLNRCLIRLHECARIGQLVLVLSPDDFDGYRDINRQENYDPQLTAVVAGGNTRQESVYNGLQALDADTDIVLIHDGARPFVTAGICDATIDDAICFGSGVISTPLIDTVKRVNANGDAIETPPRDCLRAVQTPQTFAFEPLLRAHCQARRDGYQATDDAALFERAYGSVHLTNCPDAIDNKKLTTPTDLREASTMQQGFRIGSGYDVHRLVSGRPLILCGVAIPFEKGLDGHSDADVATHALMDAMLGAAAMGDIGHLFPDTAAEYKDVSSMKLLEDVQARISAAGFHVGNADITIVAQRPKLMDYIEQMREAIAARLQVPAGQISVKATTTEHLGFEGEGAGISAQAVVLLTT